MTALETLNHVRMILDEGSNDNFFTTEEIINTINEAQLDKIEEFISVNDERALRTLYRTSNLLSNGDLVTATDNSAVFFPRSCRVYPDLNDLDNYICPTFIPYSRYKNYRSPNISNTYIPKNALYSIQKTYIAPTYQTLLFFDTPPVATDTRADLTYVKVPETFSVAGNVPLELPSEYHIAIAAYAAEKLNNIDVGERERGDIAIVQIGQRLNIRTSGGNA